MPVKKSDLGISKNSFNIIFGPSGSGKSTLLNILSGLQKPTEGSVLYEGQDIYNWPADTLAYFRARKIGFVYQTSYWVKSLSVLENVSLPLFFLGYSRSQAVVHARNALSRVGMLGYSGKLPVLLSVGEQQRVAMARALVNNPEFIFADEPTGNLDSKNGDMTIKLLESVRAAGRHTIVLVTHNMEYLPLADHLIHIQDGLIETMRHASARETTDKIAAEMQLRINELQKLKGG
ncbi:ABC transporter ATP-binding protein [Candidatus Saccharibacteria bacterium]|nr:ABC transporter ATP-binding protein [Candidatus Saccharibacteria bacterium]